MQNKIILKQYNLQITVHKLRLPGHY